MSSTSVVRRPPHRMIRFMSHVRSLHRRVPEHLPLALDDFSSAELHQMRTRISEAIVLLQDVLSQIEEEEE